jgi:hypothetical protein
MTHSAHRAGSEVRDGVPVAILEQLAKRKEALENRAKDVKALLKSWEPVLERRRRLAENLSSVDRPTKSEVSLRRIDELATARLKDLSGRDDRIFRPTGVFRPYGGSFPDFSSLGKPIAIPTKPEEIYQHMHVHVESFGDDNITAGSLFGFLLPFFGPVIGPLQVGQGYADSSYAAFDFSDNVCPEDGTFLLTAEIVAWGRYTLYSDDTGLTSREAGAAIRGAWYGGTKTTTLLSVSGSDIDEYSKDFGGIGELVDIKEMKAGDPLFATAGIEAVVSRQGAAIADLDMSKGVGGVACLGLTIEKVG